MSEQASGKVPKIRFSGFEGEWEERTLGNLGTFKNGMNFGKDAMGHGHPFVNLQNVFGHSEIDGNGLEFAESSASQRLEYNLLKGDVLFIRSSVKPEGVGETSMIKRTLLDTTYSGFIIRFRPEPKMADDFSRVVYATAAIRKQILANASRSANTNINQDSLKKIEVKIPCLSEQTKIGAYFRELDHLIELHQRKHDKLVTLKKTMLQKMFPQLSATTPEIRFKGFVGEWTKSRTGSLVSYIFNNTLSRASLNYSSGLARNVHYGDVLVNFGEILDLRVDRVPFVTDDLVALKLKIASLEDGDIVMADAAEDEAVGKCTEVRNVGAEIVLAGLHTIAMRPSVRFAPYYLGYYLNSPTFHDQLISIMQGTKVLSVSKTAIKETNICFPSDESEQQKIGTYFRTLDELISKQSTQIQKLKQIKSACLEKMFV